MSLKVSPDFIIYKFPLVCLYVSVLFLSFSPVGIDFPLPHFCIPCHTLSNIEGIALNAITDLELIYLKALGHQALGDLKKCFQLLFYTFAPVAQTVGTFLNL